MERRHVAIISPGGKGHSYPSVGLCSEFVRRGWRVTYVADESTAQLVRETGAEAIIFTLPKFPWKADLGEIQKLPPSDPAWWTVYGVVYPWLLDVATAALDRASIFYDANPPDVVLYDSIAYAGRVFAARAACPAVQMCATFVPSSKSTYWVNGVCVNPQPVLDFSERLDAFLSAFGIDQTGNLWHREQLNIIFVPREFQYHSELFDDSYCFTGPCIDRPYPRIWKNRSQGRPIILISDISGRWDSSYFTPFMEALSRTNYHVILSIADEIPHGEIRALPDNFEVNRYASHLEILPHTSLLICQGGIGSTFEAINYGVPTMALPFSPDHAAVAYRIEELGIGVVRARHKLNTHDIRNDVETILNSPELLTRVQKMQHVIRRCGGAEMAARKIEQFLGWN